MKHREHTVLTRVDGLSCLGARAISFYNSQNESVVLQDLCVVNYTMALINRTATDFTSHTTINARLHSRSISELLVTHHLILTRN